MNNNKLPDKPVLMEGGVFTDKRGSISYINDFSFAGVKRFYTVVNKFAPMVRAWHAHKKEAKYVTVTAGSALVACVKITDFKKPSRSSPVHMYYLSADHPTVVYVPLGYANGFMNLEEATAVTFYSTSTLEESRVDDYRFAPTYFDIWKFSGKKKIYYE